MTDWTHKAIGAGRVTMLVGDVKARLRRLPDDHFDCVVTSPPYWGLRDYGVDGQLGLESTLGEHIEAMVAIFREVRRVLKPEGTLWLNYGDCYATSPNGRAAADVKDDDRTFRDKPFSTVGPICAEGQPSTSTRGANSANKQNGAPSSKRIYAGGFLKPKDLVMMPNRIAIALQDDGWWVRSEIIWGKPNPMPESIKDRPATSHEKIFMLTKSERYFYAADDVRVRRTSTGKYKTPDGWDTGEGGHGSVHRSGRQKGESVKEKADKQRGHGRRHQGFNERWDQMTKEEQQQNGRNLRNYEPAAPQVWRIAPRPFKGAHFATFPPELVERCLKAGCPIGGHVLDPFGGAGTTGMVAERMQRDCTMIELSPKYAQIAKERVSGGDLQVLLPEPAE